MSEQEPSTYRPFVFKVVEDDGVNVTIEVSDLIELRCQVICKGRK